MSSDDRHHATHEYGSKTTGFSRRAFLASTAAVGAAGLGVTAGPAVADTDTVMEVDLRNGVPAVSAAPQGEDVVIFNVHGYTGSSVSVSEAQTLRDTLRNVGNTETVTAVTWDDSGLPSTAEASARDQGGVFADFLANYTSANPGTTIRILGHSMGGIVTYEMLSSTNGRFRIANADTIGSFEVSDAPCQGSEFHQPIENVAKFVGNYFSTNDGIARLGSGPADCSAGALPSNYADVDVSGSVGSHTSYKSSTGFGQAYVSNFQPGVDRGGDGGGGGDGGDGGGDDGGGDGGTGGNAPAIDNLTASEDSSFFSDAVTVNWAVSDADGDLASTRSVLLNASGEELADATDNISGSSASGTDSLDPSFFDDPTAVGFTVTDGAGNSTTQQISL